MKCSKCGKEIQDGAEFCPDCEAKQNGPAHDYRVRLYSQPDIPMLWYKSIIYFWMFAAALVDMATGALLLATTTQLEFLNLYMARPGIEATVAVFGLLWLVRFGYAFYVRSKMAEFHRHALRLFFGYQAAGVALPLLLFALVSLAGGASFQKFASTEMYISLALSAFMILSNILYFKKRAFLFEDRRSHAMPEPVLVAKNHG